MSPREWGSGVFQSSTYLAIIALLLMLFLSAGYIFLLPEPVKPTVDEQLAAELRLNRLMWENARPVSYQYVVRRTCFCLSDYVEPYVAIEEFGHRTATFPIPVESRSGQLISLPPEPVWIDDLFTLAEHSISDGSLKELKFDSQYGFPKSLHIYPGAIDGDTRYEIGDFQILKHRRNSTPD